MTRLFAVGDSNYSRSSRRASTGSVMMLRSLICSICLLWGANSKRALAQNIPSETPSNVPSSVPSSAPPDSSSDAPSSVPSKFAGCYICGGLGVGFPDREILDPVLGDKISCETLQRRGIEDFYSPVQCRIIQVEVWDDCGCGATQVPMAPSSPAAPPAPSPPSVPTTSSLRPTLSGQALTALLAIELSKVAGPMPDNTKRAFENETARFLTDQLNLDPPVRNIACLVRLEVFQSATTRQRRRRRRLQINADLRNLTSYVQVTGIGSNNLDNDAFTTELVDRINANPALYIEYLRNATPAITRVYFKPVEAVSAVAGVLPTESPSAAHGGDSGGGGLSSGAIAGIVIGAVVLAAAVTGVGYYAYKGKKSPGGAVAVTSGSRDLDSEDGTEEQSSQRKVTEPKEEQSKTSMGRASATSGGRSSAVAAAAATSPTGGAGETDSQVGSSVVGSQLGAASLGGTEDNQSYAYSMDAGNVTEAGGSMAGGPAAVGAVAAGSMQDDPDVISPATTSTGGDDQPTTTGQKYQRTVIAPAGRLGIVIDTTLEGPVVHKVNPNSALEGVIFPGDIIIAIDEVDTRAMSASNISALMVKTANAKRVLTVLSNDSSR